jgi:hypothetical protein
MKKAIMIITTAVSLSSFSANAMSSAYFSMMSSYVQGCKDNRTCKVAVRIIEDANDYIQTGIMSALLAEKVKEIQETNKLLSEQDALDDLISISLDVIKLDKN